MTLPPLEPKVLYRGMDQYRTTLFVDFEVRGRKGYYMRSLITGREDLGIGRETGDGHTIGVAGCLSWPFFRVFRSDKREETDAIKVDRKTYLPIGREHISPRIAGRPPYYHQPMSHLLVTDGIERMGYSKKAKLDPPFDFNSEIDFYRRLEPSLSRLWFDTPLPR